jgi:PEP-CTERM motif
MKNRIVVSVFFLITVSAHIAFLLAIALVSTLLAVGNARADTYAIAADNIQNGFFSATSGVTFGGTASNSSSAASLNGSGVSFNAVGPNPNAPISALGSASGRANETVNGAGYYTLIGSNGTSYSWGDANIVQEQTATATLTMRNAAETNITGAGFGNSSGTNTFSVPVSVTVGNCPPAGCTMSFAFDADPFIHTVVDAAANAGSVARGTLTFSITLTNVSNGAIVFNWTPNGTLGAGITGGLESADAENLNLTLGAFPGQDLTHSGPYASGTFGHYAAVTNALAAGSYTLSFAMSETTDVQLAQTAVPEPSTWAMMLLGFACLGFAFRQSRRKVSFA